MNEQVLYLTAPLELTALDGSKAARFRGVAYSGAVLTDWERFVVDLESTSVEARMPLLFEHHRESIIGAIKASVNDGAQLQIEGDLFSDIDDDAANIALKASRGVAYQMSIGLYGATGEYVSDPDAALTVNGRDVRGPVTVLRRGTVREVSIVALGADSQTNAAFFSAGRARPLPTENAEMPDPKEATELETLKAQVADLTSQVEAQSARADAAEQALTEHKKTVRLGAVRALFSDLGREFTEQDATPYLGMDEATFELMAKDLRALKRGAAPGNLFQEQATGDPAPVEGQPPKLMSVNEIYAKRRAG